MAGTTSTAPNPSTPDQPKSRTVRFGLKAVGRGQDRGRVMRGAQHPIKAVDGPADQRPLRARSRAAGLRASPRTLEPVSLGAAIALGAVLGLALGIAVSVDH